MIKFDKIENINAKEESTWKNKIFITIDMDWAHPQIVRHTLDILNEFNVDSTWYITHEDENISDMSNCKNIELGIHPNFNKLIDGTDKTSVDEILTSLLNYVPKAKTIRSHSLVNSERLIDRFLHYGLKNISNTFLPFDKNVKLKPINLWNDAVILPHVWQDNVHLKMDLNLPTAEASADSLIIYNFHPINIFLNTDTLERYESTRHIHHDVSRLKSEINKGFGIRDIFLNIIKLNDKN